MCKFKFIVIISKNSSEFLTEKSQAKEQNDNMALLPEEAKYSIFTSITPGKTIVYNENPFLGKDLNLKCDTKESLEKFIKDNSLAYYDFDECYSEIHPIDLICKNLLEPNYLSFKQNILLLFSSQQEELKTKTIKTFIPQFISDYSSFITTEKKEFSFTLQCFIIFQNNYHILYSEKCTSLNDAIINYQQSEEQLNNFIKQKNLLYEDIIYFYSIKFLSLNEICLCKLNRKKKLEKPSLNNLIFEEFPYIEQKKNDYFQIDKFENIFLISTVSPEQENYENSKQELFYLDSLVKNIPHFPFSKNIAVIDSLRSFSNEEYTSSNPYVNPFFENKTNAMANPISDSIIVPELSEYSISMNDTIWKRNQNSNMLTDINNRIHNSKPDEGNVSADVLRKILTLINEIRQVQNEEIKKIEKEKRELSFENLMLRNINKTLEEENYSLKRKILQKENFIQGCENKIDILNKNELKIKKKNELLKKENEEQRKKIEELKTKFIELKSKYDLIKSNQNVLYEKLEEILKTGKK